MKDDICARLIRGATELGAYRAAVVKVSDIETDASFRALCESNACGNYGRNWMCPPDAGDIHELMDRLKSFPYALVYQTVSPLEDSYDFEGMMDAAERHNQLIQALWDYTDELQLEGILHLGAGGCHLCSVCGKKTGTPCPHPDRAIVSLETHGINVSLLAQQAGMRYINGQNTVTYFGAAFIGTASA